MTSWITHVTEHLKTLIVEASCHRSKLTQKPLLANVQGIRDCKILPKYDTYITSLSPRFRDLPRRVITGKIQKEFEES